MMTVDTETIERTPTRVLFPAPVATYAPAPDAPRPGADRSEPSGAGPTWRTWVVALGMAVILSPVAPLTLYTIRHPQTATTTGPPAPPVVVKVPAASPSAATGTRSPEPSATGVAPVPSRRAAETARASAPPEPTELPTTAAPVTTTTAPAPPPPAASDPAPSASGSTDTGPPPAPSDSLCVSPGPNEEMPGHQALNGSGDAWYCVYRPKIGTIPPPPPGA
jgi:hypothetical protein